MAESLQQLEQLKKSIISDYDKGIRVDYIIQSIGSSFLKKNERKQFVYEAIYQYLMSQKKVV